MSNYWSRKVIVYPLTDDNDLWDKIYDSLEEDGKFEISPMESNIENQFFLEYTISEQGGSGDDIVKVETDDGYKYVLADSLCKYVKNVEFFKGEYYPTQTILAMVECFTADKDLNENLNFIARAGGKVNQSLIQTCQYVEQVPKELLLSFPTRLEMVGRNKGVIYHNGVFSNYEI